MRRGARTSSFRNGPLARPVIAWPCAANASGRTFPRSAKCATRRDLLEAILFPSASLARGYESYQVATKEGKVHSGLLRRETAAAIFLRTTERAEIRVSRDELEEMSPSSTSIMPQGLDKTLSPSELADLVAYLGSLK